MGDGGEAPAPEPDVSAVGTLVWVRRPNGSWWPGRVVSPDEVPAECPPPTTKAPATPILLLGRRDGPVFVDWCNLERCKRVKPFRCGETGLEDLIRRAEEQAARRRRGGRDQRVCATGTPKYARKEDAVLQALDIERTHAVLRSRPTTTATTTKPSHSAPAQPSSSRKRRTPNDSEDDAPHPPQRMKDLTDIGAPPPKQATPNNADTFADLNRHLPTTSQSKRSKQSHSDSPKRKQQRRRPSADQDQPCGVSRKRDRSRPLSELCNGDVWKNNGFTPNGHRTGFDTLPSVDTKSRSRHAALRPVKAEPVDDGFPCGDDGPARSIMKADQLHVHQPCASTKTPTLECTKRVSNCSKDGISSQCDSRNSKKKTTSSVHHQGGNRAKNAPEREHHRERAAKHKSPSNEVVLLEKRVEKSATANKTAELHDYKDLAGTCNGLDRVGAVLQQHSESKFKHEAGLQQRSESKVKHSESKFKHEAVLQQHSEIKVKQEPPETRSNHPYWENVPVPSVVFELPRQVSPPQHRDPVVARCHAVKPIKTLQLNSSLYDVEISAQGATSSSSKGGRVPLVSLMSRSGRRPVVGYPVSVEVLDDTAPRPPAPSIDNDHRPSTSNNTNRQPKKEEEEAAAAPQRTMPPSSSRRAVQVTRAKAKSRRKASEDESWRPHTKNNNQAAVSRRKASEDESWRPHTKKNNQAAVNRRKASEDESWRPHSKNNNQAAAASPRKMRRLSSFAPSQRGDRRPAVVGEFCRGPVLACIPLRLVFSRIHEALS